MRGVAIMSRLDNVRTFLIAYKQYKQDTEYIAGCSQYGSPLLLIYFCNHETLLVSRLGYHLMKWPIICTNWCDSIITRQKIGTALSYRRTT
jgi:hypothetical protein